MKLKFYHVINKGVNAKAHWVLAKDKEDAFRIASTQSGKPTQIVLMKTDDNIEKLCSEGKTGLLAMKLNVMSLTDIFSNTPQEKIIDPWYLYEEI